MQLSIAMLCDYAKVEKGTFDIMRGGFSSFGSREFPHRHTTMYIALKFILNPVEAGKDHKAEIKGYDTEGKPLMHEPVIMSFNVPKRGDFNVYATTVTVLHYVVFEKPGDYRFDVYVDSVIKTSIPLTMVRIADKKKEA